MTLKLPRQALTTKIVSGAGSVQRQAGTVTGSTRIVQKKGTEKVMLEKQTSEPVAPEELGQHVGVSGVSMELTIPGPERSYMSAKIGAACYLPHAPNLEDARRIMDLADSLVQDVLAEHSAAVKEFFDSNHKP